jgi:hypothetical protein
MFMPPTLEARSYGIMHVFDNHNHVWSVQVHTSKQVIVLYWQVVDHKMYEDQNNQRYGHFGNFKASPWVVVKWFVQYILDETPLSSCPEYGVWVGDVLQVGLGNVEDKQWGVKCQPMLCNWAKAKLYGK